MRRGLTRVLGVDIETIPLVDKKAVHSGEHTIIFIKTTWTERVREFAPYLPRQVPLFAVVTASFWGVAEVLSQIGGQALSLKNLAVPALVTALSASLYKALQKYRTHVPEPLSSESKASQQIYWKRKSGWQFALALQMLKERTDSFDLALQRIESGAQFTAPHHLNKSQYIDWIKQRPELLIRLTRSVAVHCTIEIPSVLANPNDKDFLVKLKDSVAQLSDLYERTVEYELSSHAVCPPDILVHANELTFGWAGPIRNGIREFLSILEKLSSFDVKAARLENAEPPAFSIKFSTPPNIPRFTDELQRVVNGH